MSKSIHFICRRKDYGLQGLDEKQRGTNVWHSSCWKLPEEVAHSLIGGWIYLHPKKRLPSQMGGRVSQVYVDETHSDRYVIVFESRAEGKRQPWRGQEHSMAWTGRTVEPNFEHEKTAER